MNAPIFIALASVTALFILLLIVKSMIGWKFCALCAGVTMTWLMLLVLLRIGKFDDVTIISLLIGGSIVGIYYLAEKHTREELHLFRLPFFLTLIAVGYEFITWKNPTELFSSLLFLFILWIFSAFFYLYRNKPALRSTITKLLECCKNW